MDKRIKVIQQVLSPSSKGGVSSEYRALEKSKLCNKYEFIPLILENGHNGINLHDIIYYYKGIKKEKPDIIHIRGAGVDGLNAEIAAKIYGKSKILLCIHGMYSDFVYYNKIKKLIAKYLVEPICFKLADGISCVYKSCEDRNNFKNYKKKMLPYVYNRIPDIDCNEYYNNRKKIRNEYNIKDDYSVGVYCGRVSKEKGLVYLSDALISIQDLVNFNMHFFIIGNGDYLDDLKKSIDNYPKLKSNVHFFGSIDNVKPILAAGDYFIMPSLHENHSIALLEAMAMELPTIATNVGGNKETLKNGEFGILIPPYDTASLSNAILKMADDNFRYKYKEKIKQYSFDEFKDEAIDYQLDTVYKKILYNNTHKK